MQFRDIYGSCHGVWLIDDSTSNVTVELCIFRYFYLKVNISLDVLRYDSITALNTQKLLRLPIWRNAFAFFKGIVYPVLVQLENLPAIVST